jgi:hypothetical protein
MHITAFRDIARSNLQVLVAVRAMPRGNNIPPSNTEAPANLRERAGRARRLALGNDKLTVTRLIALAEELEARATALEAAPQISSHEDAAAVQRVRDAFGKSKLN